MATEIERKFLVRGDAWRPCVSRSIVMDQGYLGGDACSVRIRIEDDAAMLNIKSRSAGVSRLEFEYPVPRGDADEMLARLAGPRVTKTRHHVRVDDTLFEIDEFAGANAGLIVAEVELDHADAPFPQLPWLGRQVTDDPRFYNLRLAVQPFSAWADRAELIKELTC